MAGTKKGDDSVVGGRPAVNAGAIGAGRLDGRGDALTSCTYVGQQDGARRASFRLQTFAGRPVPRAVASWGNGCRTGVSQFFKGRLLGDMSGTPMRPACRRASVAWESGTVGLSGRSKIERGSHQKFPLPRNCRAPKFPVLFPAAPPQL